MSDSEGSILVAVDFGTSMSGHAFDTVGGSKVHTEQTIRVKYDWPGANGEPYPKAPTQLLYSVTDDGGKTLVAWGYTAASTYLKEGSKRGDLVLVKNFKMRLFEGVSQTDSNASSSILPPASMCDAEGASTANTAGVKGLLAKFGSIWQKQNYPVDKRKPAASVSTGGGGTGGITATTSSGRTVWFEVLEVVADMLRVLKDDVITIITSAGAGTAADIRWVLTVPAIWDARAKDVMRRAAVRAGMIGDIPAEHARLALCLEPEAAALRIIDRHETIMSLKSLPDGTRILVVDVGGGTVDITLHECRNKGALFELCAATGGPFGSAYVDKEFEAFLASIIGREALDSLYVMQPVHMARLFAYFEPVKRSFTPGGKESTWDVPGWSRALMSTLEKKHPESARRMCETFPSIEDCEELALTNEVMTSLYEPVIQGILNAIEVQLNCVTPPRKCDHLFLVGGFASSLYLQQRIRDRFGNISTFKSSGEMAITVPADPGVAVVAGAVMYGLTVQAAHSQQRILNHVMRYTYGISACVEFVEGDHPEERKWLCPIEHRYFCEDVFSPLVSVGDSVPFDEIMEEEYTAVESRAGDNDGVHSDTITKVVSVYATKDMNVQYVDEAQHLLDIKVKLPSTAPDGTRLKRRYFYVRMSFGESEIKVRVVNKDDPRIEECATITYLQ